MNWESGYSAAYYLKTVDASTWRDIDTYDITGGSVSRKEGGLQESANIEMRNVPALTEAWVRVYLDAKQGETGERQPVFTGLMSVPSVEWDGRRNSYTCECYSVLKPAADVLLRRGWYSPAGANAAQVAARLLSVGAAPVVYSDNAPLLTGSIIAEDGETNLSMAEKVLEAVGWRARIAGDGTISIEPNGSSPVAVFDALDNDMVELSLSDTRDWFGCPNVFRASADDLTAIARDDDPDSELSTVARGREVWMEESNCILNDNESIAQYALRRLKEAQRPARHINYSRRYHPDVTIGDVVSVHLPAQNISGDFRIISQQIELGYGARTSEEGEAL